MARLKFLINGAETKYLPIEYKTIGLTASYYPTVAAFQTKLDELNLALEDMDTIEAWRQQYGMFQGIPFDIFWEGRNTSTNVFNGQIDLSESYKNISINQVNIQTKLKAQIDWFEKASEFSFLWLEEYRGLIQPSDFVPVPYIINYVPDNTQVLLLAISLFTLIRELVSLIRDIANIVAELITGASALGFAQILAAILKIVLLLAYAVAVVFAIIELVKQLREQLFPPIRYHWGMKAKRMLEVGAEQLGYTFKSDLFDQTEYKDLVVLPPKSKPGYENTSTFSSGVPYDSIIYMYSDYVFTMLELFNAQIFFENNNTVMRFERRDYKKDLANFELKNNFTNQKERYNEVGYNTDEFNGSFLYSFQTDLNDQNTLDNFRGTNFQVLTRGINVPDEQLDNTKNHREVRPPYALGTRKDELTELEEIYKKFANRVDNIVSFFGGNSNFAGVIDSRKGVLSLSDHATTVPKLVMMQGNRLKPNQRVFVSAKAFYNNFYCIESFVPVVDPLSENGTKVHNQWIKKTLDKHKIDADDFVNLQGNNYVKTADNKIVLVEKLIIDSLYSEIAKIDFRENVVYDNNLEIVTIEAGGNA